MNTLSMYSREKANKIHLDEMHREAQRHRFVRFTSKAADSGNEATRQDSLSLFVVRFTRWFSSRPSQTIDGA
jgi:hypothetical protein